MAIHAPLTIPPRTLIPRGRLPVGGVAPPSRLLSAGLFHSTR